MLSGTMPHLANISIFPIKSLDGVTLSEIPVLKSGALPHDREFAIVDEQGRFINGKRNPKVHLLRSTFDAAVGKVWLQKGTNQKQVFQISEERDRLEAWLSKYFGFPVKLRQDCLTGFPDDTNAPGPTVISTGTLEEVASWFPGISVNEMRLRLRTNIEISGVSAFWEDKLFAEAGEVVRFQVGEVVFAGVNPCQRCVVPTRDVLKGEVYPNFQKDFIAKRKETMPACVELSRFNHFFRLGVNTQVSESEAGKVLRVGDEVKILGN